MQPTKRPIVVTGAEGQLGFELCRQLGERAIGLARGQCNLTDITRTVETLKELHPSIVINTAAYTAVDRAESEAALCHAVNADAVAMLADRCRELDCVLVQISTDYVFGADHARQTPYQEDDEPGPINVYGHSKLAGERHAASWRKHFIVRSCGLYGYRSKPTQSNFVDTMLRLSRERDRLRIVDDQHCSPSYVVHLAQAILFLMQSQAYGIYHVVNDGETTWYDFAREIFRLAGASTTTDRISAAEYGSVANRPRYSVLGTDKYRALGGPTLPHGKLALAEYLQSLGRRSEDPHSG